MGLKPKSFATKFSVCFMTSCSIDRITTANVDAVWVACQNATIAIIYLVSRTTGKYNRVLFSSGTSAKFRVFYRLSFWVGHTGLRPGLCTLLRVHHLLAACTLGTT